jgi:hypothetical protein
MMLPCVHTERKREGYTAQQNRGACVSVHSALPEGSAEFYERTDEDGGELFAHELPATLVPALFHVVHEVHDIGT